MTAPLLERKLHIGEDFDRVATGYDRMCRWNPGYRRHLRWSAQRLQLPADARILDLCCGTGLSTAALRKTYPRARLVALDLSQQMLAQARAKAELRDVAFHHGDATDPRVAGIEGHFDGILMAYGLRNFPQTSRALPRILELLRPGGTICIHEYSVRDSRRAALTFRCVCDAIVIPLGRVICGSDEIFRYLRRSVLDFDGAQEIQQKLRDAGFARVRSLPMDGWQRGIVHSFLAERPL